MSASDSPFPIQLGGSSDAVAGERRGAILSQDWSEEADHSAVETVLGEFDAEDGFVEVP